jgi:hypothetical protein
MSMHRFCAAAGVAALAAVAACAPKDKAPETPPAPTTPNVVTVHASDFALDVPATLPAGMTTFKLVNNGPNLHHMVIARLDSGKTYDEAKAALSKPGMPPMWLVPVGGPNAPDPNTESNVTLDLKAGNYVAFCVVDIPGGVPHLMKGMINPVTVTASSSPSAPAPTADVKVSLQDYSFQVSPALTAGKHVIQVDVAPGQPHEIELVKIAPGKKLADFMGEVEGLMKGKAPAGPLSGTAIGGVAPSVAGTTQYFEVDLSPGNYAFICFLPDAKDGKPHLAHGMVHEFSIQ